MDKNLTQKIVRLDNPTLAVRAMMKRREEILLAIEDRTVEPTKKILDELAELNIAIGDVPAAGEVSHD